jgi:tRNA nucleotidyltransferase/poly(A) polymerase
VGELGWSIERETRGMIRKLKGLVRRSSSERITLEIFRLLNSHDHLRALKQAFADGLISKIIACKTERLRHNIKAISSLDSFLKKIPEEWEARLGGPFSQGLCYAGLLRAEQLLYGAASSGSKLTLSRAILNRLRAVSELLERVEKDRNFDDPMVFDLFSTAGEAVMDFALLTRSRRVLKKAVRFLGSSPVLTTAKLMRISGVPPGPELGHLLRDMKKMQFLGKITDEKEALKWLCLRDACGLRVHETGMRKRRL